MTQAATRRRLLLALALCSALAVSGAAARAAGTEASFIADWLKQDYMTGDWGGRRTWLRDHGLDLNASFVAEFAGNPSGGLHQGLRVADQLAFGADVDLQKLDLVPGATLHVTFSQRAGRSLASDVIGNIVSVQEIFGGGQNFRLAELSYEQALLEDRLELKLGRIHAGDDFATSPVFCEFQNNNFCGNPVSIPIDSGFSTFPVASWGGFVKAAPVPAFYAQTGVYEVNPSLNDSDNGFKLGTSGSTGVIVPVEFGWLRGTTADEMPGNYKLGGYYDTSDAPDLGSPVNGPVAEQQGRWGVYLLAEQMVYREAAGSRRGLTVFGGVTVGDPETALIQYFVEAGMLYRGTFPGRDEDTVGLGFAWSGLNRDQADAQRAQNAVDPDSTGVQTWEAALELNYKLQLAPWLGIRPNLQYVFNPGGTGEIDDAFVIGLQTSLTF